MLVTCGQAVVARWCGVTPQTIAMWIIRRGDWPEPDAEVHTGRATIRGWLPSRKQEWERYASAQASSPGARLVAMRKDRQDAIRDQERSS